MTGYEILVGIAQALAVGGVCFAVVCLLASYLRFQWITRSASVAADGETEPDRALQIQIARLLGTGRRRAEPFTVALVGLRDWPGLMQRAGAERAGRMNESLAARVRDGVRGRDLVTPYRDGVVGVLLKAEGRLGERIGDRIMGAIATEPFKEGTSDPLPWSVWVGAAAFPEDGHKASELRDKADAALRRAESLGEGWHWPLERSRPELPAKVTHAGVPEDELADQQSLLDPQTGVLKKEHLTGALQKIVAQSRREGQAMSVIVLDIDYLRRYNEQYGRRTGDQVLKHVADYLKQATREDDLIARMEGDEFAIALAATAAHASNIAQRLWLGLRRSSIEGIGSGLRITVSMGISGMPDHGLTGAELLETAQLALQTAKARGRNQCVLFQDGMRKKIPADIRHDAF